MTSSHLDPETIAAWLDRRLDATDRARAEEHLADCEECRTLLTETAAFLETDAVATPVVAERRSRRTWIWSTAAAAAALLALTPLVLRQMRPTPESALRELDQALAGKRYIEGRLSGFEYGELVSAMRGPSIAESSLSYGVLAAAKRIEDLTSAADTSANLATLGAAQLALGRVDEAIEHLEDAVRREPKSARIQSDLAAAYLARFRATSSPEDPARAIEAADTAVSLDATSRAAAFNRALALEALPLRSEALQAWESYLAMDASSKWGAEARAHIEELKRPLPAPPPSPSALLDELETDLLPDWGRAVLASQDAAANVALSRARTHAIEVEHLDGDRLALGALDAIDAASSARLNSLARAHVLIGEARRQYLAGSFADADGAFLEAHDLLQAGRSPYADWALMRRSACLFQRGEPTAAWNALARVGAGLAGSSRTLRARRHRLRAVIRGQQGDPWASALEYDQAASLLSQDPGGDDSLSLPFLMAENLDLMGERFAAWTQLRRGLSRVMLMRVPRQRHVRMIEAALLSARQQRPALALELLRALDNDPAHPSDRTHAEAELHRARILLQSGSAREAWKILSAKQIETTLGSSPRMQAELRAARGETMRHLWPDRAIIELSEALEAFKQGNLDWRLPALHLQRGLAYRAMGHIDEADADFVQGLALGESQRLRIAWDQRRITFFALSTELLSARLSLALERGLDADALMDIAEQGRARGFKEHLAENGTNTSTSTYETRRRLPHDTAILAYGVLGDRLVVWKLTHSSADYWVEDIDSTRLAYMVFLSRAHDLTTEKRTHILTQLYDLLVRRAALATESSVIIIPDGCLHSLAFASLLDETTGKFLIEQHAVVISPSVNLLTRPTSRTRPRYSALIFGALPPAGEIAQALPFGHEELASIAAMYPGAVIASGTSATGPSFLRLAAQSSVVHFIGHAKTNLDTPFMSYLSMTDNARPGDGRLLSEEIERTKLSTPRVVVLAACSTGLGQTVAGEGAVSLARPFLVAGVPSVVASLWDVEDRSTAMQLVHFHRGLLSGEQPADALRHAQMAMLASSDPRMRDPRVWAAFQVYQSGLIVRRQHDVQTRG
jgi:CHAT domain-containing protein